MMGKFYGLWFKLALGPMALIYLGAAFWMADLWWLESLPSVPEDVKLGVLFISALVLAISGFFAALIAFDAPAPTPLPNPWPRRED